VKGERGKRCPTCGSRNPWFTKCQDWAALTPEEQARYGGQRHRRGCADSFHKRSETVAKKEHDTP